MIYCPKCGARNPDESVQCAGCGASFSQFTAGPQGPQVPQGPQAPQGPQGGYQPPDTGYRPPKPPNYLVWSIISTVCCCIPAGIVSIVFAAKVDSQYNGGDYAGATDSSNKAKMWAIVAASVGFVVNVIVTILQVLAMGKMGQFQGM